MNKNNEKLIEKLNFLKDENLLILKIKNFFFFNYWIFFFSNHGFFLYHIEEIFKSPSKERKYSFFLQKTGDYCGNFMEILKVKN
jgi:hypothetical protein